MSLGTRIKGPSETLLYTVDWSSETATVSTSSPPSWTVSSGLTHSTDSYTTSSTTVKIAGGTAGNRYLNSVSVTDSATGEIFKRYFRVKVVGR